MNRPVSFPASLPIPEEVRDIAATLERAGHETWCVGGAVRDNLLGQDNKDFDLATAATPAQVRKLFRRTVPIGVEHGTVAVLDEHRRPHEVTTFRKDVKTDGRHAVVEFGASFDEDLARRDFTINAIAYHPVTREWRDRFDGLADLSEGIIRAVGDPEQRFREDYLRILRALRFAARFGFEIEGKTWVAAVAYASGLEYLSAERVRDEWMRGLQGAHRPSRLVESWNAVGAFEIWMPEMAGGEQGAGSGEQVGFDRADRFPERDAVLITSYLSADPAMTLSRLRCSNAEIERARRIGEFRGQEPDASDPVAVRRWLSRVGPAADDLLAIAAADERGERLPRAVEDVRQSGAPLALSDLAVDGTDLTEAGIAPGPRMGTLLASLLDAVLENPSLNTKEQLLELVRRERREP